MSMCRPYVDVSRTYSGLSQCQLAALSPSDGNVGPYGEKPCSMRIDRKYLASLATTIAAMHSFSVLLAATVGCSFDLKANGTACEAK
jgi:hypothetical protein